MLLPRKQGSRVKSVAGNAVFGHLDLCCVTQTQSWFRKNHTPFLNHSLVSTLLPSVVLVHVL